MRLESGFGIPLNWPEIRKITKMTQVFDITTSSKFFDVALFLLSSLFTGASFMSI